nr:hypothetical protein [Tanacetum cinerariifolium]
MPDPVKNAPKVVCEPKVWTDAPIIEEYESDSDNDSVSNIQEDKEKPSFPFNYSVKHVKTSRENVKESGTPNHSPKIKKHDRNGHTRKGLGYAFSRKSCFVCGSFSHLISDCDFHEKMAKQAELSESKNKVTGQRENRQVWNKVQRVNHQNKFVPSVLTKTVKFPVNAARQNYSSQAASTSTASKVNTARPFVNETRTKRNFYNTYSPNKRPFHNTKAQRTTFSYQKVNTVGNKLLSVVKGNWILLLRPQQDDPHRALKDKGIVDSGCFRHMTGNKAHLADYQEFKEETDLHEEHFVLPIWSAYSTTVKSSGDKIRKNTDFKTCEKPVSQVGQIFLMELEKLKRQKKEANDAAKSLRKEDTHDI